MSPGWVVLNRRGQRIALYSACGRVHETWLQESKSHDNYRGWHKRRRVMPDVPRLRAEELPRARKVDRAGSAGGGGKRRWCTVQHSKTPETPVTPNDTSPARITRLQLPKTRGSPGPLGNCTDSSTSIGSAFYICSFPSRRSTEELCLVSIYKL